MSSLKDHKAISFVLAAILATAAFLTHESAARAAEPPANQFTLLVEAQMEMPAKYSIQNLIWVDHMKAGLSWPQFWKEPSPYFIYSSDPEPSLKRMKGSFKAGNAIDRFRTSPLAYCYMPKAKKILFLQNCGRLKAGSKVPTTWTFDPGSGVWEAVAFDTQMAPRPAEYDPNFRRGRPLEVPIWGKLVYDPVNGEVVHFGGAGTWGRVTKTDVPVAPGDWIFDEAAKQYRCIQPGETIKKGKRWFPARCGTWTFSEKGGKWSALEQPMREQPPGRFLPAMVYVPDSRSIVLFGGDDLTKCLSDTWEYDCAKRTWKKLDVKGPTPRAGSAFVYVPDAKQCLLVGGYANGWKALRDSWVFDPKSRSWSMLEIRLPEKQGYVGGCYDPERKLVLIASKPDGRRPKSLQVFGLRFDPKTVKRASPPKEAAGPVSHIAAAYPGRGKPDAGADSPKLDLAKLPANTWVKAKATPRIPKRDWGQIVYDEKTHRAISWGGGHSTYAGLDYDVYDLSKNRWYPQAVPAAFNPRWWHGASGCPPGVSYHGYNYVPGHSRRGYGVDPISGMVATCGGDVFDFKTRSFVKKIRRSPFGSSGSGNPSNVTAPHGLYFYGPGTKSNKHKVVARVNVKEAKWEIIVEDGPAHHEFNHIVYDSKRDRMVYFQVKGAGVHTFDFKTKKWEELKTEGARPDSAVGGSTYVPELGAVCMLIGTGKRGPDSLYFFKLEDRKWYTAPYKGARFRFGNTHGLLADVHYDPKLKTFMYFYSAGADLLLMRLDTKTLELTPLKK